MKTLILHVCSMLIVVAGTTFAQQTAPLRVTLRLDRTAYNLNGDVVIQILLTNTTRHPIDVYSDLAWGESASVSIWFKDKTTGKAVDYTFIPDSITPPPTSRDDFVKILPEHVYGVSIRSRVADLNIRKKGVYEVVAEYHSPVPSKYAFGLPIWSREDGTLTSNRVTIKAED